MSLFRKSDYAAKREKPKKAKIPTQEKSQPLETCPFCSKKAWSKKLRKCSHCKVQHTPERPYTMDRASNL